MSTKHCQIDCPTYCFAEYGTARAQLPGAGPPRGDTPSELAVCPSCPSAPRRSAEPPARPRHGCAVRVADRADARPPGACTPYERHPKTQVPHLPGDRGIRGEKLDYPTPAERSVRRSAKSWQPQATLTPPARRSTRTDTSRRYAGAAGPSLLRSRIVCGPRRSPQFGCAPEYSTALHPGRVARSTTIESPGTVPVSSRNESPWPCHRQHSRSTNASCTP